MAASTAKKDLKYFMQAQEQKVVTVPGLPRFKDENGDIIPFEIRILSQQEIIDINDAHTHRAIATDKKGNPLINGSEVIWKTERDNAKITRHTVAEALQYPNLKDKDLMEFYGCVDVTEMPLKVFSQTDEYRYVVDVVLKALGIRATVSDDEELDDAKN